MTSASRRAGTRGLLRAAALTSVALTLASTAGTAYATPTAPFGSKSGSHGRGRFGGTVPGGVYNGTQAVTELTAVAAATRAASTGGALITGTEFFGSDISHVTVTLDGTTAAQVCITGADSFTMIESATEQYLSLDLTDPDVLNALQLLHATGVHYVGQAFTDPMVNPADMLQQLYTNGAPPIGSMTRTEHAGFVQYQVTVNVPTNMRGVAPDTAMVITDRTGRLVSFQAASSTTDGEQYVVQYGPHAVSVPSPQDVVDSTQFQQALVSGHLPGALAAVAEEGFLSGTPSSGTETLTQFRAAVRAIATDPHNGMGGIAVTVADVPSGVTLTARNPFTNVNVQVRAVLSGDWVTVTDAAGRPVEPDGITISAPLRLGRTPAARLVIRR